MAKKRVTAKGAVSISRGNFLIVLALALLLLSNLVLLQRLGAAQQATSVGAGYAPAGQDYSFWLAVGGILLSVALVATVLVLKFQQTNEWIEESFF